MAYKLDSNIAHAVTEAVKLLVSQGERIAELEEKQRLRCGMRAEELGAQLQHIVERVPWEDRLCQLAEEAAELAQAALKLRRCYSDTNPTPVPKEDAIKALQEEIADVWLVLRTLDLDREQCREICEEIMARKTKRWAGRLEAAR